jgi:zinc protease
MKNCGLKRYIASFILVIVSALALAGCCNVFGACRYYIDQAGTAGTVKPIEPMEAIFHPSKQWPHMAADLAWDPDVIYRELPNGFRYIMMQNNRPEQRVSMHLFVPAGAMHESESERGVAHFLEHLLFCGTEHFSPGELVKYFQSIGMKFGPDANAQTGFYTTVYDIDLPKGDAESLKQGLLVMRDYAVGALIPEDEVERERQVVLAEKRTRDSVGYRTFVETFNFELPDALLPGRLPIGEESVLKAADREMLKGFYDAWYRPERMILIMAGDFDIVTADALIRNRFTDITARASERAYPDPGYITHGGTKAFHHFENEAGSTSVSIEVVSKKIQPTDSTNYRRERLYAGMANHIVNNRLSEMLENPETPFTHAVIHSGIYLNYVKTAEINAECPPEKWEQTLSAIEQVLRRAVNHGFTDYEIDLARREFSAELEKAVKTAPTRESRHLARQIIRSLNNMEVFQSPQQRMDLLMPMVTSATRGDLHAAIQRDWSPGHRLVIVTGNTDLSGYDAAPDDRILTAYFNSQSVPVAPVLEKDLLVFPYLPIPERPSAIAYRKEISDLGIVMVQLENGVWLNIKKTDFKANQVMASLVFGNGRATEPQERPGLSTVSQKVIHLSGLGEMNRDTLRQALAGTHTTVSFQVAEDHFAFAGHTVSNQVETLFQLYHAHLTDPGFREDAHALAMQQLEQELDALAHTIQGGMAFHGNRFLAGGDSRFVLPEFEVLQKSSLEDVRHWVGGAIRQSPLELSIVGDVDVDAVIELAALYLGNLPPKKAAETANDRMPSFPAGQSLHLEVPTRIPKGMVTVAFPTIDYWNIDSNRRLSVLSEIFTDRMRQNIREAMGAAYSYYAYNDPSRAYPGFGMLSAVVLIDPADADNISNAVKNIAHGLASEGVSSDEVLRAVNPILTSIAETIRTNTYWLNTVLKTSSRHPQLLDWCRTIQTDYAAVTPEEISALARQYLNKKASATVVIVPEAQIGSQDSPEV